MYQDFLVEVNESSQCLIFEKYLANFKYFVEIVGLELFHFAKELVGHSPQRVAFSSLPSEQSVSLLHILVCEMHRG